MSKINRLLQMSKLAQGMDPSMGGGMPMDPNAMAGGGGMPMDPSMMGGGGMPMDPSMMGMAPPQGMPPMDPSMMGGAGMPMDPSMMGMSPQMAPPAAPQAIPIPMPDPAQQAILDKAMQVAESAIDLAKAQTDKMDAMSSQVASVLSGSGAIDGLTPQDLQGMAEEQKNPVAPETVM